MKKNSIITALTIFLAVLTFVGGCGKSEEVKAPETPVVQAPQAPTATPVPGKEEPAVAPAPTETPSKVPGAPPAAGVSAGPSVTDIISACALNSDRLVNGAPTGWVLDKKSGSPSLRIEREGEAFYLHFASDGESSFGVKKGVSVNIKEYPVLNWRWKAIKLPDKGDVRKSRTDDQALQIYIAFPAASWPEKLNTPVIGYIWDNEAPKGWTGRSSHLGGDKLRYVVVRNKTDQTGEWITEKRNIYQDYQKLFKDIKGGQPLGPTKGIELYINSQNTGNPAEGCIAEVFFSKS